MRAPVKIGLVLVGYVGAFVLGAAVVRARIAATSGPDRQTYAAMFGFGDDLVFLAVFGVAALVPTAAALFFLRPYRPFWRRLSVAALAVASTAVVALFQQVVGRGADAQAAGNAWAAVFR
jgi:hypothetical protein